VLLDKKIKAMEEQFLVNFNAQKPGDSFKYWTALFVSDPEKRKLIDSYMLAKRTIVSNNVGTSGKEISEHRVTKINSLHL